MPRTSEQRITAQPQLSQQQSGRTVRYLQADLIDWPGITPPTTHDTPQ